MLREAVLLLLSTCGAPAARTVKRRQQSGATTQGAIDVAITPQLDSRTVAAHGALDATSLPQRANRTLAPAQALDATSLPRWSDASWKELCWGEPDPAQQLSGEVTQSICARLHQNASFLVFGLGRDSALWHRNALGKIAFLEDHEEWLQFQEEDVVQATRVVAYTSDAESYQQELHDEAKLAALYESLPSDIKETRWDMILVDAPMGMETNGLPEWMLFLGAGHVPQRRPLRGTPGRIQSIYAATRLAREGTLLYIDDFHRTVEREATRQLLRPGYRMLKVFSSGHRDNIGMQGKTALLVHEP